MHRNQHTDRLQQRLKHMQTQKDADDQMNTTGHRHRNRKKETQQRHTQ